MNLVYNNMSYSKEDVIGWFSDLNVMNSKPVNNHLDSLRKYGNKPVGTWTKYLQSV